MAENSSIQWTTHTFNPWRGCTKVSAGCANCYAETLSGRNPKVLGVWGPNGTRVVASENQWKEPVKWNKAAEGAAERPRVFCASLADVFEDWSGPMETSQGVQWWKRIEHGGEWTTSDHYRDTVMLTMQDVRARLFALIADTPHLDWLLLTKRPQNVLRMAHDAWCKPVAGHVSQNAGDGYHWHFPPNVWLGTTVENQAAADERIPQLLKVPARVRFLSCEPLLGPVDLSAYVDCYWSGTAWSRRSSRKIDRLHWVIVGGESGQGSRGMQIEWARSLVAQCKAAGVSCFVKQLGAEPLHEVANGCHGGKSVERLLTVRDKKGGDWSEWPADLRVREFPTVPH